MSKHMRLRSFGGLDGYLVNYLLCGPFNKDCSVTSCEALEKDYLVTSGSESSARPASGMIEKDSDGSDVIWTRYFVRYGFAVNLISLFDGKAMVNYTAAYIHCPTRQKGKILIGSDDGFKLYLNGILIGSNHVHRGLGVDSDILQANFKQGINFLLMKVEHNFGGHEFCIRITDNNNKSIKGMYALLDHPRVKHNPDPVKIRTISSYDYLAYKFASAKPRLAFNAENRRQFIKWKKTFLDTLTKLLKYHVIDCPLKPEIVEEVEVEKFRRSKVLIDFEPGFSIPCYITQPHTIGKGEKLPAILCLHGHGNGKADMVGLVPGTEKQGPSNAYSMAFHAAQQGYITISPDFLAFGERAGQGTPYGLGSLDHCSPQFAWAQSVGIVTTALNFQTVKRCVDYLCTLKYVDTNRIAAMGHSFGGYMTMISSVLEPRISAAVISGFLCTVTGYHGKPWQCGSQVIPGLFLYGDLSDVACTIAPRPVMVITGLYDDVTPAPFAMAAFKKLKKAYAAAGSPDSVTQFTFPGDHVFRPDEALNWLTKWL